MNDLKAYLVSPSSIWTYLSIAFGLGAMSLDIANPWLVGAVLTLVVCPAYCLIKEGKGFFAGTDPVMFSGVFVLSVIAYAAVFIIYGDIAILAFTMAGFFIGVGTAVVPAYLLRGHGFTGKVNYVVGLFSVTLAGTGVSIMLAGLDYNSATIVSLAVMTALAIFAIATMIFSFIAQRIGLITH